MEGLSRPGRASEIAAAAASAGLAPVPSQQKEPGSASDSQLWLEEEGTDGARPLSGSPPPVRPRGSGKAGSSKGKQEAFIDARHTTIGLPLGPGGDREEWNPDFLLPDTWPLPVLLDLERQRCLLDGTFELLNQGGLQLGHDPIGNLTRLWAALDDPAVARQVVGDRSLFASPQHAQGALESLRSRIGQVNARAGDPAYVRSLRQNWGELARQSFRPPFHAPAAAAFEKQHAFLEGSLRMARSGNLDLGHDAGPKLGRMAAALEDPGKLDDVVRTPGLFKDPARAREELVELRNEFARIDAQGRQPGYEAAFRQRWADPAAVSRFETNFNQVSAHVYGGEKAPRLSLAPQGFASSTGDAGFAATVGYVGATLGSRMGSVAHSGGTFSGGRYSLGGATLELGSSPKMSFSGAGSPGGFNRAAAVTLDKQDVFMDGTMRLVQSGNLKLGDQPGHTLGKVYQAVQNPQGIDDLVGTPGLFKDPAQARQQLNGMNQQLRVLDQQAREPGYEQDFTRRWSDAGRVQKFEGNFNQLSALANSDTRLSLGAPARFGASTGDPGFSSVVGFVGAGLGKSMGAMADAPLSSGFLFKSETATVGGATFHPSPTGSLAGTSLTFGGTQARGSAHSWTSSLQSSYSPPFNASAAATLEKQDVLMQGSMGLIRSGNLKLGADPARTLGQVFQAAQNPGKIDDLVNTPGLFKDPAQARGQLTAMNQQLNGLDQQAKAPAYEAAFTQRWSDAGRVQNFESNFNQLSRLVTTGGDAPQLILGGSAPKFAATTGDPGFSSVLGFVSNGLSKGSQPQGAGRFELGGATMTLDVGSGPRLSYSGAQAQNYAASGGWVAQGLHQAAGFPSLPASLATTLPPAGNLAGLQLQATPQALMHSVLQSGGPLGTLALTSGVHSGPPERPLYPEPSRAVVLTQNQLTQPGTSLASMVGSQLRNLLVNAENPVQFQLAFQPSADPGPPRPGPLGPQAHGQS
ncbi:MAG: hypothetical protein AB1758_22750, partial [Candidatus Eremiobacterota bacterium]